MDDMYPIGQIWVHKRKPMKIFNIILVVVFLCTGCAGKRKVAESAQEKKQERTETTTRTDSTAQTETTTEAGGEMTIWEVVTERTDTTQGGKVVIERTTHRKTTTRGAMYRTQTKEEAKQATQEGKQATQGERHTTQEERSTQGREPFFFRYILEITAFILFLILAILVYFGLKEGKKRGV